MSVLQPLGLPAYLRYRDPELLTNENGSVNEIVICSARIGQPVQRGFVAAFEYGLESPR
jgi:hypothetical protein